MFALPEHEREAFFALLDEYFTQRPHLAPPNFQASAAGAPAGRKQPPPPPRRGNSTSSSVLPPSAAAAAAHAPPPATPGPREVHKPAGLQTGKVCIGANAVDRLYEYQLGRRGLGLDREQIGGECEPGTAQAVGKAYPVSYTHLRAHET